MSITKLFPQGNQSKYISMLTIANTEIAMVQAFFMMINPQDLIRRMEWTVLKEELLDSIYGP